MASKASKKENTYLNIGKDWEVKNVRDLDFGTFFTLQLPGLALYNLRVVPSGRKYDAFIGMPEEKGKDGNYYNRVYFFIDDELKAEIIRQLEEKVDA